MTQTLKFDLDQVCSSQVTIELEGEVVRRAHFEGGCEGNLQGLCNLMCGMKVSDIVQRLKGIDCDGKGTSCPDQLAHALEKQKLS